MKRHANEISECDGSETKEAITKVLNALVSDASKATDAFLNHVEEFEKRSLLLAEEKNRLRLKSIENVQKEGEHGLKTPSQRIIKLNVGGKRIDISRRTVTHIPSRLAWILSGRWDHLLHKDKDDRLFFDFDPEWFEPIINHLRELVLQDPQIQIPPPAVSEEHIAGYERLLEFFDLKHVFCSSADSRPIQVKLESTAEPDSVDPIKSIPPVEPSIDRYNDCEAAARFPDMTANLQAVQNFERVMLERSLILHKQFQGLEKEEEDFRREVDFMSRLSRDCGMSSEGSVLYFNIGGTLFCVSQRTLKQAPDSMLCTQYGTGRWEPQEQDLDDSGAIFLDLNAYCFARILSKLRFMVLAEAAGQDAAEKARSFDVRVDSAHAASFSRMLNYFQLDRGLYSSVDSAI